MSTGKGAMESDGDHRGGAVSETRNAVGTQLVGSRVREERLRQHIGVRELARRVGVSASLVSQVELGKASPSVGTLYAIVNELGLSLDELFFDKSAARTHPSRVPGAAAPPATARPMTSAATGSEQTPPGPSPKPAMGSGKPGVVEPVVRHRAGKAIQLATGVRWERLTPETPQDVDFLYVTYVPGSESCPPDSLMRHSGLEYGHVLEGRLGITIGFETYELGPGDSVSFESTMPHRLFALGDEPALAIWFVVGRRGDPRMTRDR